MKVQTGDRVRLLTNIRSQLPGNFAFDHLRGLIDEWITSGRTESEPTVSDAHPSEPPAVTEALRHFVESWGGNNDWAGRKIDTEASYQMARAALADLDDAEALQREDDPISDSRQPEDGPPPGRWPR